MQYEFCSGEQSISTIREISRPGVTILSVNGDGVPLYNVGSQHDIITSGLATFVGEVQSPIFLH